MAESSDNQLNWVNWLTVTAEMSLSDATHYSNNFTNYGIHNLKYLQDAIRLDENFLTSSDIGMKKGHAIRVKSLIMALSPRANDASHVPPAEGIGQVKVSSGSSILLPGNKDIMTSFERWLSRLPKVLLGLFDVNMQCMVDWQPLM